jgi:hypothetical protein
MRLRNLCGRTWVDSPLLPLFIALLVFAFSLRIWSGADWSPILFSVFRPHRTTGVVISVELNERRPSDGDAWEVRFEYLQRSGGLRTAVSWASAIKRGIFSKQFPRPIAGSAVEVEEFPALGIVRIKDMRTGWLSLDGALWLIFLETLMLVGVYGAARRPWRGNRLLVSGNLGRARLEGVKEIRGRGTSYRMTYRLVDAGDITFNVKSAKRQRLADGEWNWCLYEPARPEKAVLLAELRALPAWAQELPDARGN